MEYLRFFLTQPFGQMFFKPSERYDFFVLKLKNIFLLCSFFVKLRGSNVANLVTLG